MIKGIDNLTKIFESKLDKKSWKTWKFSDVVENINEKITPKKSGLKHYIGLEHLDSGSLHIKRYGEAESLVGDKLKIYKGDLIFAKRNAYLKRVAIAEFDAVASAHSLVLRAKPENICPEFLPFFLLSEYFWNKAIEISVGSLSPTINWKALAKQEFILPPNDLQIELAELLWAGDEVVEADNNLKKHLSTMLDTEIESKLHGEDLAGYSIREVIEKLEKQIVVKPLKNMGAILKGKGITKSEVIKEGLPCIRYGELYTKHHRIVRKFDSFISIDSAKKATRLKANDVLIAGSGETITEIGKSAAFVGKDEAYAGSDILVFRPIDMDGSYLGYLMNSQLVRQQLNMFGTGATVMHVYASDIERIKIPERTRTEQQKISSYLESISERIIMVEAKIVKSKALQNNLINQVF